MISRWFSHLKDGDEKSAFIRSIYSSKHVLERLGALLREKGLSLVQHELSLDTYETPAWAYKQAHINGYLEALDDIQKIINLDQKD